MMISNPAMIKEIAEEYKRYGCSFIVARKLELPPSHTALVCNIIDILQENYNNE
ncbi:hypothetical protein ACFH54_003678 [Klebsiella pneumoniae]